MSYGVDIIAKKNQESQIQLSNLDTEHLWTTGATELTSNLTVLTGNTRSYMYKRYSPWRTEIANSLTWIVDAIYFTARYTGEYIIYRSLFDINPPASNNIKSASITISRSATAVDAGKAYLYGLTRFAAGTTSGADWSGASLSAFSDESTYNNTTDTITFVLNTAGLAYINSGGVSFMIKSREDVLDIAPTFSGSLLLFDSISGSCVYDSTPTNLIDGLLSSVADVGTDSTLVPLTQTDANYRPQSGYDKLAGWNETNAVVVGSNVTGITNAETSSRAFGNLTATAGTEPQMISGNVVLQQNDTLNLITTNKTIRQFTSRVKFRFDSMDKTAPSTPFDLFAGLSDIDITILNTSSTLTYFMAKLQGDTSKAVRSILFETLTPLQFETFYKDKTLELYSRFATNKLALTLYVDSVLRFNLSVAISDTTIVNTAALRSVTKNSSNSNLTFYENEFYETYLSDFEIAKLVEQSANYTYQLPRTGITSNGSQFMSSLVLPVNTVINTLTVSCWVYLANVLSFATQAEQVICSTDGFTNLATDKGFQLKVQKLTGDLCRFQVQAANGTSIVTANSASLSLSAFRTAYANKWNLVALTVSTDTTNDTLTVLVNSVNLASTSATTGIYNTGTGTVLAGARSDGFNIGAGNRIEHLRIDTSKAMDATESYRLMLEDKITYPYLTSA